MADGQYSISVTDYSKEKSSSRFHTGQVTALTLAGLLTEVGALRTAIDGIILGVINNEKLLVFDTPLDASFPTDHAAQRESKWLMTYRDNTATLGVGVPNPGYNKLFSVEIPTADPDLLVNNTDYADLTATEMAAFKTAFEAMAKSPYGGAAVLLSAKFIGRNL